MSAFLLITTSLEAAELGFKIGESNCDIEIASDRLTSTSNSEQRFTIENWHFDRYERHLKESQYSCSKIQKGFFIYIL